LPAALLFNALGLWVLDYLDGKQGNFVFPRMLVTADFWGDWLNVVTVTFSASLLVLAVIGIVVSPARARLVAGALLAGYVIYGLVFTWNYSTHHYYHLPLILVVALGIGFLTSAIDSLLRRRRADPVAVGVATVAAVALASGWLYSPWRFVPQVASAEAVEQNVAVSEVVGQLTNHTDHALVLAEHYGYPLAYYGAVKGTPWPWADDLRFQEKRGDPAVSVEDRFAELVGTSEAEFFVITDLDEWGRQPDLETFLRSRFPVHAEGPGYLIFDLR
jgi:hypothetical protein